MENLRNQLTKKRPSPIVRSLNVLFLSILMIVPLNLSANLSYSKSTKINLKLKKTSVANVLSEIERKTEFSIIYVDKDLDLKETVSIDVQDKTADEILSQVFKNRNNVQYEIKDKHIIIYKKNEESVTPQNVKQGTVRVTGTIVDKHGEPIIGGSVVEKGVATNGTITDIDGKFTLMVKSKATLILSYIGYTAQEVVITNNTDQGTIVLEENAVTLEDVVVVGYGTQRKINLTGAVDAISSKSLENRAILSAGQGLQGAIPNLNIGISSGSANSAPSFNIRGTTSINGGEPLIVIDNMPATPEELSRLNTNDIETVSILKDASSAAIYGARGAFGVVLITTKSAKSGKINVSVNGYYSFRRTTRLPEIITDPYDVMVLKNEASRPLYNPLYKDNVLALAKKRSENPDMEAWDIDPNDTNEWIYFGRTKWMDEVYRKDGPMYNINASVSQRTEKGGAYLSVEYARQDGMFRLGNDIYERYNLRAKADYRLFNIMTISNNTNFTSREYDEPGLAGQSMGSFFHQVNRTSSFAIPKNPDGTWTSDGAGILGRLLEGGRRVNDMREFTTSFNVDIDLMKNVWQLKADANFKLNSEITNNGYLSYQYKEGPDMQPKIVNEKPSASASTGFFNYYVYNIYTDFHKKLGEHYVQGVVGFNQEYYKTNAFSAARNDLISLEYPTIQLATGEMSMGATVKEWAVRGLFMRANYSFKDRYLLEFSARRDGSSKFPKKKRFGFFPSGSAGWIASEESFMKPLKETIKMDMLKFRASYGQLGNQAVSKEDYYPYIASLTTGRIGTILNGEQPLGIYSPGLVSNNFTWEKVSTLNFGVDLAFLNNRLNTNFDYYTRDTKGMLAAGKILPNVLGISEPKVNGADLRTKGFEFSILWRDQFIVGGSPLNYSAKFIISDSFSKITKLLISNKQVSL